MESLTFVGLLGLNIPIRDGMKECLPTLKRSGINVRVLTGASMSSAKYVALNAGILQIDEAFDQSACMEGSEVLDLIQRGNKDEIMGMVKNL